MPKGVVMLDSLNSLLTVEAYPHAVRAIRSIHTQMSVVFLTGDYAYKVKKPVNLGYLDYSTLEKRHLLCQKELELNRRLCPEAYLAVVPLVSRDGGLKVDGPGRAIEYAVKMRQLPHDRMMDFMLVRDQVTEDMLERVAAKLADFHAQAGTGAETSAFGDRATIRRNAEENFEQTEQYVGLTLTQRMFDEIQQYTNAFLERNQDLFRARMETGMVRDCHGDLHAEHVCFTHDVCIYDCIEFNDRFRYSDVASEVAFLAMDLDRYSRGKLACAFARAYAERTADDGLFQVLNFYKCYRAYVRGKVEGFKLADPEIEDHRKDEILQQARTYFRLALLYARKPFLIITSGLIGTGKSTVAQSVAERLGCDIISSDVTRKHLAGIPLTEHRYEDFQGGIYSEDFSRRTYESMLSQAAEQLAWGNCVILDASFAKTEQRAMARNLAREHHARFLLVECVLADEGIRARLERRAAEETVSDARWDLLTSQKASYEQVTGFPDEEHLVVDTSGRVEEVAQAVREQLLR